MPPDDKSKRWFLEEEQGEKHFENSLMPPSPPPNPLMVPLKKSSQKILTQVSDQKKWKSNRQYDIYWNDINNKVSQSDYYNPTGMEQ